MNPIKYVYHHVKILTGQSLSDVLKDMGLGDCSVLVGIIMPAAWDAANLTFQACHDANSGGTYRNIYDKDGTELTVVAAASRYIMLEPAKFAGIRHLKVRSGTSGAAVSQTADRTITFVARAM